MSVADRRPWIWLKGLVRDGRENPPDHDRSLVEGSGLFDSDFYLREHPNCASDASGALDHFVTVGWREGARPSVLFDTAFYLSKNQDVARAGINPLVHYLRWGWREGRQPSPLFDTAYYLGQNPDVAVWGREPLWHFLRYGAREGRKPNPLFDPAFYLAHYPSVADRQINPLVDYLVVGAAEGRDPSADFDTSFYCAMYQDVVVSGMNPLAHYVLCGREEGRIPRPSRSLEGLRELWKEAAMIDPSIAALAPEPEVLPIRTPGLTDDALGFARFCAHAGGPFDYLIAMPFMKRGGADREAAHLVKYLAHRYGQSSVVVVVTDSADLTSRDWFPKEVRVISFDALVTGLRSEHRARLIANIALNYRPRLAHNVNSLACWEAFARYGRSLSAVCRLGSSLFCYDYTPDGVAGGYASRFLDSTIDHLSYVVLDNAAFGKQLIADLAMPADLAQRLTVVYQPTDATQSPVRRSRVASDGFSVLWAGRLDRQKRPDLLNRVATACGWADFHVFGAPVLSSPGDSDLLRARNIHRHGDFSKFADLDAARFDCFLYTTQWDGMPNVLLEAVGVGLPVVAPAVGGIPELITGETGYLVARPDDVPAFVEHLKSVRDNPEEASRRATRARELLTIRHSWAAYEASLAPLFCSEMETSTYASGQD